MLGASTSARLTSIPAVAPQMLRPSIGQHEEYPRPPGRFALRAVVVAPVEDVGERHLERLGDLVRVDRQRVGRRDDADDRGDLEPGAGDVGVEPADDADELARQADLLLGLAQRGGDGVGILLLDPAAGKRDLPGMRREMRRALGQQHASCRRMVDQRHQHRGRAQRRGGRRLAGVEVVVAARRRAHLGGLDRIVGAAEAAPAGRPARQPRDQFFASRSGAGGHESSGSPRSKNTPSLHSPNGPPLIAALGVGEIDQLVKYRAIEPRLEPRPHQEIGRWLAVCSGLDAQRMLRPGRHNLVEIGPETEAALAARTFASHLDGEERCILDGDAAPLDGGNQPIAAVVLAAQDGGKEFDERCAG